eukprot:2559996-Prymnesium_polylepis.1
MLNLYTTMYFLAAVVVAVSMGIQLHASRVVRITVSDGVGATSDGVLASSHFSEEHCEQTSLNEVAFKHCQSPDHVLHCRV